MLQNACLLAKIGAATAENEEHLPQKMATTLPLRSDPMVNPGDARGRAPPGDGAGEGALRGGARARHGGEREAAPGEGRHGARAAAGAAGGGAAR